MYKENKGEGGGGVPVRKFPIRIDFFIAPLSSPFPNCSLFSVTKNLSVQSFLMMGRGDRKSSRNTFSLSHQLIVFIIQ